MESFSWGGAFEAVGRATYIKHVCKQQYDVFDIETVASFFFHSLFDLY